MEMANENELRVIGDIEEVSDFDKLYEILKSKGVITGSICDYEACYLIDKISQIREELEDSRRKGKIKTLTQEKIKEFMARNEILKKQIRNITKSEGLRAKVKELAIDEVIEKGMKN